MGSADGQIEPATVLATARAGLGSWRHVCPRERAAHIGRLRAETCRVREEIVRCVCAETAKTPAEALLSDVLPTLEILRYLERNTARLLRPQKRPTPMVFRSSSSRVEYRPRGVVLVIAPWNNPFQLSLVPVASALAAGNAVVLKPSERTPHTGELVGRLCAEAGLGGRLVQVAAGGPEVAQGLIDGRPDMVFFTGGGRGGRAVLSAAATHLIPVILELGGKDPMLVFADADLARAARAVVYGTFAHAGQHCVSTKRLYVENSVYDAFLGQVAEATRALAATSDWGRVVDEAATPEARAQVREALASGARLLAPQREGEAGTVPTLVADATHAMRLVKEETFAPVLAAIAFATEDEAVRLANDSPFGLNASVWTRDRRRARRVVSQLETGNVYVNNVLINIGSPSLPFGGVKASGIGRYHGPEGLRAFCAKTSVMVCRSRRETEPHWFPHNADRLAVMDEVIDLRYSERGWLSRLRGWLRVLLRMRG